MNDETSGENPADEEAPRVQMHTVAGTEEQLRVDRWFQRHYPDLPHGHLQKLLRTGQVRVDGKRVKSGTRLTPGQRVRVPPLWREPQPDERASAPAARGQRWHEEVERLSAAILYRDDDVLAVNKPAGLAVQGGTGIHRHVDELLDGLRFECAERPRLVHRLDRDTSGVLLLARTVHAAGWLARAFRQRDARKLYWALVVGVPRPREGRINLALAKRHGDGGERMTPTGESDGKRAVTEYRVVEATGPVAWLALEPHTGRTHQLRAHCAALGTPIAGDRKYGGADAQLPGADLPRTLHLHARSIALPRPDGTRLEVTAPLPPHMVESFAFFGFEQHG